MLNLYFTTTGTAANNPLRNSILISSGDNFTFALWYLQMVEKYRTDVSVVDINLLHSIWYPSFLANNKIVSFDVSGSVLDTLEYTVWENTTVTINDFSWKVKPSYHDQYMLRGDLVFLSLLRDNKFNRDIFFTIGNMEESMLNLNNYIHSYVFADKLTFDTIPGFNYNDYLNTITEALKLSRYINLNSPDELRLLDNFRYLLLNRVNDLLATSENKKAKKLFDLLDKFAAETKYPYQDEDGKNYADKLRETL